MSKTTRRKIEYCGPTHLCVQTTNIIPPETQEEDFSLMDEMIDRDRMEYRRRVSASFLRSYLPECTFDNIASRYDAFKKNYPIVSSPDDTAIAESVKILTKACKHPNRDKCAEHYKNLLKAETPSTELSEPKKETRIVTDDFISIIHEISLVGVRHKQNDDQVLKNIKIIKRKLTSSNPKGLGYLIEAFNLTEEKLALEDNELYQTHQIDTKPGSFERKIARQFGHSIDEITVVKSIADGGTIKSVILPDGDKELSPSEATLLYKTGFIAGDSKNQTVNQLATELLTDNDIVLAAEETSLNYDFKPKLKQKYVLNLRETPQITYLKRYDKCFSIVCDKKEIFLTGRITTRLQKLSNTELFVLFCLVEQLNRKSIDMRDWNQNFFKDLKYFSRNFMIYNRKLLKDGKSLINSLPIEGSNFNGNSYFGS